MLTDDNQEFNSLDPLGPQFGKANQQDISSEALKPFEGAPIKPVKDYFPVIPQSGALTRGDYAVKDLVTGNAPNQPPARSKQKISAADFGRAAQQHLDMQLRTNQNKNNISKIAAYNAGPSGNSFYKRYAAYGQEKFDKIGFSPTRDNEALYNSHTTAWNDFSRMMTNSFVPLFSRGFVSGPKSLLNALGGDFSGDTEDAKIYEEAAAIGQSSKGGFSGFFNNTAMNFAYTAGIITEAVAEEVGMMAITAATGGATLPALFATTANAGKNIFRGIKGLDKVNEGFKAVNNTLKSLNNIDATRKLFTTVKAGVNSKVGKFINPFENVTEAFGTIAKNENNLEGLARTASAINKTAGGLFRDVRNANMALSEARLEAGMTENSVYDKIYTEYYKKNGVPPDNDTQFLMLQKAKEAGMSTLIMNTALIYGSNKIVLPNILGPKGGPAGFLRSKVDDVLNLKDGKVVFEQFGKKVKEGVKQVGKGEFKYVEDTLKNTAKQMLKQPGKALLKSSAGYFKGNIMEGVQENLQEVIAGANEKYYSDALSNRVLGTHINERGKSSLMMDEFGKQFTSQGFETFASGFFMGMFAKPFNAALPTLFNGYNRVFNKDEYLKYKELRKSYGEGLTNRLNTMYSDPKEFFNSKYFNYGAQNELATTIETADSKLKKDAMDEAFGNQVMTALETNTINYFTEHLSSMKDMNPDEFEEAFGFEKGTGAKYQGRIDSVIEKTNKMQQTYKYANDRFPNPVNLNPLKKGTEEYNEATIFSNAWEHGKRNYVLLNQSFNDTMTRMSEIMGTVKDNPSLKNMNQADIDLIFEPNKIGNEVAMLKTEIEGLKLSQDPASKQQAVEKQNKLDALSNFLDVHTKHNVYHNRSDYAENLFEAYKKKTGETELSEETKQYILDTAFGEKTKENTIKANSELEDAYKNYLKVVNGVNNSYVFDTDIDESFNKLLDHYTLDAESKKLVTYINLLHNPKSFVDHVEKTKTWMSNMYNNRKEYYTNMVNKQLAGVETNALLNQLADLNIFVDLDVLQDYMENDVIPKEFFDESSKQVIPKGTKKYNEIFNILALNKRLKAEDVEKPTLDTALQEKVESLDAQESKELDELEKVETIKIIKHEIATTTKLTIDDVLKDLDDTQYVDAKYDGSEEILTMYLGIAGVKLNNSDGELLDTDAIKDKFSEYTIYKKSLKADPEEVKAIKEKYNALRDQAAEAFNEKKAKTKADIYSNFTPVKQLPADLVTQLKTAFSQTEEALKADEDDISDEELDDIFNVFVKNNSLAADIILEYNDNSKAEVEKEKLGEIDDFDFISNNKKLNTADYSNDDIRVIKKQFEELRDNADTAIKKTAYETVINKFDKLLATRSLETFTPEVQEIIKTLKNELLAKQSNISKLGEEGYLVSGQILGRVTNFIEPFKTDKYKYAGSDIIKKAFENTIAAVGLSKTSIPSFIKVLKAELHVDSEKGNFGYTDETESIIKKHLDNLLKQQLDKVLFKNKEELLADIQGVISENTYEASRDGGTYIDDQLRRFFTKGEAPKFDEKKITREAYDSLFGPTSFLKDIKQKIDSGELYTIANNLKLYDVDSNVAGEMDLLLIDKEGKLQIIDFKTGTETKWNGFVEQSKSGKNKTEAYTLQQYTYARLLKKMTGLDAEINIFPIETILDQNNKIVTSAKKPTSKKLTGPDKWYFSLDPSFADVKTKIDKAISIEAPVIKVATALNPVYKKKLKNMNYPDAVINDMSKEEAQELTSKGIPFSEYMKQNASEKMSFGKTAAETVTAVEETTETVTPVTKASELNLQKDDTVIVKESIPEFAEKSDTLTVLKSDENSVSFTNKGKEKTLTLQELNKHTTTMDILKTEQAESTPEILDAIDKQTINETVDAFNTFMGDTDAIAAAIKEADAKSMSEIENDLLDNLDC